jgi:hypothetical protein
MSAVSARATFVLVALSLGCAAKQPPPKVVAVASGGLPESTLVTSGPEVCGNALDDNGNGIADEGCGIATGMVQFLIAWDEPNADVDLRVMDPNGELAETGRPTASGLVKERDCPGREGECRGRNLENVYLEQGELVRGEYRVRIRLVSLSGAEPPISVRFAARVGPRVHSAIFTLKRVEADFETVIRL